MSPIYTGDKFGFGASTSAGGGGPVDVYNNAGMVFTTCGAYGNAGPTLAMAENEYRDQKFWTDNHYHFYTDPSTTYTDGGFIFVRAPQSGTYTFRIRGAFGGQSPDWYNVVNKGGSPWYLEGDVDLVGGRWIGILVGQKGGEVRDSVNSGGGGGGGTYLFELDGSESETALTNSYIESASVTCLLVASGGNGANWQSWNSQDTPARDETSTGSTDWILDTINAGNNWGIAIFGRGAFGGSFNYTPYSTVNVFNAAGADAPWYNNYGQDVGTEARSGMPILDSSNKISNKSGLGGIHWEASNYNQRYNQKNRDPNSNSHGAIGGFGGGAGGRLEGGGGGGYWGGAAWQENQYNTIYNYGAQSYAHPTRVTVTKSRLYGDGTGNNGDTLCGMGRYSRSERMYDNQYPHRESHGKLYLCPKKPKATAIGEAVFHADGNAVGYDQNGVGKVTNYDWYVPEGVTNISVLTVGGGGGGIGEHDGGSGGGGALSYKNNITVTPGQKIEVQVGCGGFHTRHGISQTSPKGTDSKITVYPPASGNNNGGSLYLDGSSVVKISDDAGGNSIFEIPGSTPYCYEAWIYLTELNAHSVVWTTWDGNGGYHNTLWRMNPGGQMFIGSHGGSQYTSNNNKLVTINNWHHVCVASNGSSGEFYVDGVNCGGWTNSNHNQNMQYGAFFGANMDGYSDGSGGSQRFHGYISNFRYVVGHKTYDTNFTPPTSPLTETSQGVPSGACKFLSCQDTTDFGINSVGASLVADYGSPSASGKNPFGADSPTGTTYAESGGGYGVYRSGSNCASSQNDPNKGRGGEFVTSTSDGGGRGGNGMQYNGCRQGGGGAGGYNGQGWNTSGYPSNYNYSGCGGAMGHNGGGGGGAGANGSSDFYVGGGGGTGIYGEGNSGQRGDTNNNGNPDSDPEDFPGKGGSPKQYTGLNGYSNRSYSGNVGGAPAGRGSLARNALGGMTGYNRWRNNYGNVTGQTKYYGPDGGFPGGGGGGGHGGDIWGKGGDGVVRIIWGAGREFPSTNVDISTTYDSDADVFRIGSQPMY